VVGGRARRSAVHAKQALSALLFLYCDVLEIDLPWMNDILHPKDRVRVVSVHTLRHFATLLLESGYLPRKSHTLAE
jgi:hypothetical protein